MSQENVEIVRAIYMALNDGDWDVAFRLAHSEFEATFQRGPIAGTHRGRDSIQAIVEDQREAFDAWTMEVEQVVDQGDQVVVVIKSHLRPRGDRRRVRDPQRTHLDDPRRRGRISAWLSESR